MWIFNAIANAVGKNFIGTPNYLFGLLFNRVKADGGVTEAQQCTIEELTELQNDNLLSSASLVVTPSSYKEGKLYSVVPTDGSGDLSVTRATTATRVNSAGLVELVPYNLVRYSEQFDNAAWDKVGIGGGLAPIITNNAGTAPNGTLTADRVQFDCVGTTSTFRSIVGQGSISTPIGAIFTQTLYVKAYAPSEVGKQLRIVSEGTNNSSIITITADWQRIVVNGIPAIFTSSNFNIETRGGFTTNTTADVLIWGAQLNEGTIKDYQRTETRLNIPRLDYSLGSCPSLLLEPQRTNLALWSEQFDNASWLKLNGSVTANSVISPDGIQDADSFVENTATGLHIIYTAFTSVSSTTYTVSTYIKPNTRTQFYLRTDLSSGTARTLFDLTGAGSVVTLAHSSATIVLVSDGWYRATITFTEGTGGSRLFAIEGSTPSGVSYTGNGLTAFYLYGAQLEVGAYPTSYIPTTSATVTRNGDVINRDNVYTNNWITANGGTWFLDLKNTIPYIRSTSNFGLFLSTIDNGFGGNGFVFYNNTSASQRPVLAKYVSGTLTVLATLSSNNSKIAIKWNGATADVFENGIKVVSDTAFTGTLMQYISNQLLPIPFNINAMALWPTPLNDDQLELLTGDSFYTYAEMASYYNYTLQ
jgi:hypothetical protein